MARKTIVTLIDDLDGSEADQSVFFSLDGKDYRIDLSSVNAAALREQLGRFVAVAEKVGQGFKAARPSSPRANNDARNAAIRDWAREQGEEVSVRGRIPHAIVAAYDAAH